MNPVLLASLVHDSPGWVDYSPWEEGYNYLVGDIVEFTFFGGDLFICLLGHVSNESRIPGFSPGWGTYWAVFEEG